MNTVDYNTGDTVARGIFEYTITKVIYGEEDPNTYMPRMRYNLVDKNGNTQTRVRQHEIKLIKKAEILKVKSPEKNLDDNMEDIKASGSIIIHNGKMLVLKETKYKDAWIQSGGKKDGDETPKDTAKREVFEEIGINLDDDGYTEKGFVDVKKFRTYIYEVDTEPDVDISKEDNVLEYKWIDIKDKSEKLHFRLKTALSQAINQSIIKIETECLLIDTDEEEEIVEDQLISLKNFKGQSSFNAKLNPQQAQQHDILKVMTPGKKRWLYEWTDYQSKIKPFYDIDIFTEDEAEHEKLKVSLLEEWTQRLTQLYPDGNISVATSHGPKVKTGTKKKKKYTINGFAISFHFIVNGYETTMEQLREFNETNKLYDFDGCDKSVYRDGGNMRLLYSYKFDPDNRQKVPYNNVDNPEYHLIQSNSWSNTDFKAINLSPPVSPVPKPVEEVVEEDEEIAEFEDEEIEVEIIKKPTYDLGEVARIIEAISVDEILDEYNDYLFVGMALHNITNGDEVGLGLFKKFHSCYNNVNGTKRNPAQKWKSFGISDKTNKLGITTLRKFYEKVNPVKNMTLQSVFMSGGDDLKSKKTKMLKEMNERLIFVKETGDYIILDKKPVLLEDGTNIMKPCWYLKTPSKAKDHFNKEKFSYTYTDENDKTKEIKINPFNVWCEWIERREVRAIGFDPKQKNNPDIFNLWNGFNISKEVADGYDPKLAQPILDHIKELWCKGNEEHYNYVLNLFSHYIQKPHIKTGVLLALKSKQGGGKGIILEKLGQIIGDDHYCQNSNAKFLFGDFNGQLEGKILINLDEAFWGGDKALEGVVKNKITERRQTINKKNKENYVIDDYANYIITTNNDWFAGTSEDDRRHYCLELHNKISGRMNKKTKEYVKPVLDAPAEAFANILYNRDISDFCPRIFKKTDLLQEQVERNWNSVKVWFHQTLKDGGFTDKDHKDGFCPWNEVPEKEECGYGVEYGACQKKNKKTGEERVMYYKDYLFDVYNQQSADGRKFSREAFYRELKKNCLGDLYVETRPNAKAGVRLTYVILPDIDKTRENWNEHQEYDYEWDNDDEWE